MTKYFLDELSSRARSKLAVFVRLAHDLAGLSRCSRMRAGCVVVPADFSAVLSVGYNGPPAGEPNDGCRGRPGDCGCVHAEANAMVKLSSGRAGLLVVATHHPCEHCAGLVVNHGGVAVVVWSEEYRSRSGLDLLARRGVAAARVSPSGDPRPADDGATT